MTLEAYFRSRRRVMERALKAFMPKRTVYPALVHDAMRYGVFSNGKRFRPILALAVTEALGGSIQRVLPAACAIELIHSYSLIHDDLPALDNDDVRRGAPSCHRKFGEPYAILAGDGLLTLAFEVLARHAEPRVGARMTAEIAHAAGTLGMIGGQVVDLLTQKTERNLPVLDYIHTHKTGQLIRASCVVGAIAARATARQERAIRRYGELLGLVFQLRDDILDGDGSMRVMSVHEACLKAQELGERAKAAVLFLGARGTRLKEIAESLPQRNR